MVLTESADYLTLSNAQFISTPATTAGFGLAFTGGSPNPSDDISGGCMTSGNLCLQLFSIAASDVDCPTLLTGSYNIRFDLGCNTAVQNYDAPAALCAQYQADFGNVVDLNTELEWEDNICDPLVFEVEFDAVMTFYTDNTFATAMVEGVDQYNLGDQAFVEVFTYSL